MESRRRGGEGADTAGVCVGCGVGEGGGVGAR